MYFIMGVTTDGKPADNFPQVYFCVPGRVKIRVEMLTHQDHEAFEADADVPVRDFPIGKNETDQK